MTIGKFIQERRLSKEITLRQFAKLMNMDASNWSKIERDKLPFSSKKFNLLIGILGIEVFSPEWFELGILMDISQNKIPFYVKEDEEIFKVLPIFFRTAASKYCKPTEEEIEELIKIIRER